MLPGVHKVSTRPYSYHPWLPKFNSHSRQSPYCNRPHTSNYRHPFWRSKWREDWNKRTNLPQRDNNVPMDMQDSQDKRPSEMNSEADFTSHQIIGPAVSSQIENSKDSLTSNLKKYPNREFLDIVKPNSSKITIDMKTAKLADMSLPSSTANFLSPLEAKTLIIYDPIKISPYMKYHGDVTLEADSKSLNAENSKLDVFFKHPETSSINSGDDKRTKLHKHISKSEEMKSTKSLHSGSLRSCDSRIIKFPCSKKITSWDADIKKLEDYYLQSEKAKLKKPIGSDNANCCDFPLKPSTTMSIKSRDAESAQLTNTYLKPEAKKLKKSVDTVRSKHGNAFYMSPETQSSKSHYDESIKLHDSSLSLEKHESSEYLNAKGLERCEAILEFPESQLMRSHDNGITILCDLSVRAKKGKTSKYLDRIRSDAPLKPPTIKSIISRGAKNIKLSDSSLKHPKSKSNRTFFYEGALKKHGAPLKPSDRSLKSRNEERTKLQDSTLMPGEDPLKKSHDTKSSKHCNALLKPSDTKSMKDSHWVSTTTLQNSSILPEESTSSIDTKSSRRCDFPLSSSETKSKRLRNNQCTNHSDCYCKPKEAKSKKSLDIKSLDDLKLPESKFLKSRYPVNTQLREFSLRPEEAKLKKFIFAQSSKYYDGCLEPPNVNLIWPRGDESTKPQYLSLTLGETSSTKSHLDNITVKQREASSTTTDVKSIRSQYGENTKLRNLPLRPEEVESNKFFRMKKCPYSPLKHSDIKSMRSCYVEIMKLDDSFLRFEGTKLKNSLDAGSYERHDAFLKPLEAKSIKSRDTENTSQYPAARPKEAKTRKSLGAGRSKRHEVSLKPSEVKIAKSRDTESTKLRDFSMNPEEAQSKISLETASSKWHDAPRSKASDTEVTNLQDSSSKPEEAKLMKSFYARSSKLNNAPLTPSETMTANRCDTEGTSKSTGKHRDPSSKNEEAKMKKYHKKKKKKKKTEKKNDTENVKCLCAPLKHSEANSIKLRGAERSKPSDSSLKRKACDEDMSFKYLDAELSEMFGTSPKTSRANSSNIPKIDGLKHIGDKYIVYSENKLLKLLEDESTHVFPAEPLKIHKCAQKNPLNQKAESLRPPESDKNSSLHDKIIHGTTFLKSPLLSYGTNSNKFVTPNTTKVHVVDYVKSSNTISIKLIDTDSSNLCTAESSLTHRKVDPIMTPAHETPTTCKNSQPLLKAFISNKHLISKDRQRYGDESSTRSPEAKFVRSHEADGLKPYPFESFEPAEAQSRKGLGSEGMMLDEAGPFKQPTSPAMTPAVSHTKKRIIDQFMTKPIRCVKYQSSEHYRPQSLDPTTASLRETINEKTTRLREPESVSVKSPEDYQSKRLTPERYMWTSKLKICGVHLLKQQRSPSEKQFDSENTKPRISEFVKPPTTFQNNAPKNPVKPSKVESNQLLNIDCSMPPESSSFNPISTENATVSCTPFDPLKDDLLKYFETSFKYSTTSEPTLLPEENKKLSYTENNCVSEVYHSGIFPAFSSPICYSPIMPPEVGYASPSSKSVSPAPSANYGSSLEFV